MDHPAHATNEGRCGECGGGPVGWRVKRIRPAARGISHLTLQLDCRDCGASREESLDPGSPREKTMQDRDLTGRGTENSAEGKVDDLEGKAKEAPGGPAGSTRRQQEGKLDQLKRKVQDAFGKGQRKVDDSL